MGHTLFLVRHGEQIDAEHGVADGVLSGRGVRQAQALASRLSGVPFTNTWHSPWDSASDTMRVLGELLPSLEPQPSPLLLDCVPSGPTPDMPQTYRPFFTSVTEVQVDAGRAQMDDAVAEFLGPGAKKGQIDLLITHNAVIGWFVREALGGPEWRWLGTSQAHCAITVLHQRPGRPWTMMSFNDVAHLPVELRTGLIEPYVW